MSEELYKPQAPPPKRSSSLIVPILVAALVGGGIAWVTLRHAAPRPTNLDVPRVKEVLHLDDFVVNLAGSDNNEFLKVGIALGQFQPSKGGREDGNSIPAIRDTILTVIAKCKADDLLTPEGKDKLKQDLLIALQQRVPEAYVTEVYFTDFLVQR